APTQLLNSLRRGQGGQERRNLRIANSEQRAGARRLQYHFVAAPAQICEPRQDENVAIAEPRRLRPVIGKLRLDDDLVGAALWTGDAVLQETVSGQSPDQPMNVLVDAAAAGRKRAERHTRAQLLAALSRARAECSQAHRVTVEAGDDFSPGARF